MVMHHSKALSHCKYKNAIAVFTAPKLSVICICMNDEKWIQVERIASELGVRPAAIVMWRQRRVPVKWRIPILQHAIAKGIELTMDDLT